MGIYLFYHKRLPANNAKMQDADSQQDGNIAHFAKFSARETFGEFQAILSGVQHAFCKEK